MSHYLFKFYRQLLELQTTTMPNDETARRAKYWVQSPVDDFGILRKAVGLFMPLLLSYILTVFAYLQPFE